MTAARHSLGGAGGGALAIDRAVYRSHRSPQIMLGSEDNCTSSYGVDVTLVGPAGISRY